MKKQIFIFIGPPGSGKGTQAELLGKKLKLGAFTIGSVLRSEIRKGTKLGQQLEPLLKKGLLVPDEIIGKIITNKISHVRKGIILDGFPRKLSQAKMLAELLKKYQTKNIVLEINVPPRVVLARITGRLSCKCGASYHIKFKAPKRKGFCDICGKRLFIRKDSRPAVVEKRLKVYTNQTKPVINFFKKNKNYIYRKVDGAQAIEKVQVDLVRAIKKA